MAISLEGSLFLKLKAYLSISTGTVSRNEWLLLVSFVEVSFDANLIEGRGLLELIVD